MFFFSFLFFFNFIQHFHIYNNFNHIILRFIYSVKLFTSYCDGQLSVKNIQNKFKIKWYSFNNKLIKWWTYFFIRVFYTIWILSFVILVWFSDSFNITNIENYIIKQLVLISFHTTQDSFTPGSEIPLFLARILSSYILPCSSFPLLSHSCVCNKVPPDLPAVHSVHQYFLILANYTFILNGHFYLQFQVFNFSFMLSRAYTLLSSKVGDRRCPSFVVGLWLSSSYLSLTFCTLFSLFSHSLFFPSRLSPSFVQKLPTVRVLSVCI